MEQLARGASTLGTVDAHIFPCDICGETDAVDLPKAREVTGGQTIRICRGCGLVYVPFRRPSTVVADVWSHEMAGQKYRATTPLMLARHTYVAEFLHQRLGLDGKRVVDIGAWDGQFLGIIRDRYGAGVFGIEPSSVLCEAMRARGIPYVVGTCEDVVRSPDALGERADVVTMLWMLENATVPRDLLMGARSMLRDGGHLVIATGSRILVPPAKPFHLYLGTNPVDTHPLRFSERTLTSILSVTGFTVRHVNPYLNDGLLMCMIAEKEQEIPAHPEILTDDVQDVVAFFERWQRDSDPYIGRGSLL